MIQYPEITKHTWTRPWVARESSMIDAWSAGLGDFASIGVGRFLNSLFTGEFNITEQEFKAWGNEKQLA